MGFESTARRAGAFVLAASVTLVATLLVAPGAEAETAPKFDKAYMSNAANIEVGKKVWTAQCRHCHGASAYPGKAPKLSPGDMEPDFIFDRVTNGFRKMPGWKDVFSQSERMGVVAYIKSNEFSP